MTMTERPKSPRAEGPAMLKLQAILKSAYNDDKRYEFECGSRAEAMRLRARFYNAMRNAKDFPEQFPEMAQVLDHVGIELRETKLSVGRHELSKLDDLLDAQLRAQGVDIKPYMVNARVAEVEASATRIAERLAAEGLRDGAGSVNPAIDPDGLLSKVYKPNPYYRREGSEG